MAKKKKTTNSKKFSIKEFLILHVEKLLFGLVVLLAGGLVALGFMAQPYSAAKTPEKLSGEASQVSNRLKENHWEEIVKSQAPIVTNFKETSGASRRPISVDRITIFPPPDKSANRRGDPALSAPIKLQAKYYYGPMAFTLPQKQTDPLDKLDDAKKTEEAPKGRGNKGNKFGGFGGEGDASMGSYGSDGMGGMGGMGGPGMQGGPMGVRFLAPGYDRGFQMGMRTIFDPMMGGMAGGGLPGGGMAGGGLPGGGMAGGGLPGGGMAGGGMAGGPGGTPGAPIPEIKKIPYAQLARFVVVTALAPHQEMELAYKKEFSEALGYVDGRDTPNYVGFEVQRVEITEANANRPIEESEWQDLPKASCDMSRAGNELPKNEEYKKITRGLIGTCSEVAAPAWVDPNISMPILPMLLNDFRKYAGHPDIPQVIPEPLENEWEPANTTPYGTSGGFGGYGDASMGGYGDAAMGSYGSDAAAGMGMGMQGSDGYGGGYGGDAAMGGYGGMQGGGSMGAQVSLPKRLPSTKYKLVRFFDAAPPVGKTFKYRVRLLMYDSNFPEYNIFQPRSNTLKTESVLRVQKLLAAHEPKEAKPKPNDPASNIMKPPVRRPSKRETAWSEPSAPVTTVAQPIMYAGFGDGTTPKTELVVAELVNFEFQPIKPALYVPMKYTFEPGSVLGFNKREKGKEVPEVVLPVSKVIKLLKTPKETPALKIQEYVPSYRITVVNEERGSALKYASSKDPLKTGTEIVTYDDSGQLIISREFDDFTGFHMFTKPDVTAVGPLGGGLKTDSAGGYGSGGYGMDSGMSSGSGGGGKMGGGMGTSP
ncbi:MAG: hypothetical protein ABL921_18985 [Pirellula sp.]